MAPGTAEEGRPPAYHTPVMAEEVAGLFRPVGEGVVVDATFGGGGHTRRLLAELGERARIVALDRDPDAAAFGSMPRLIVLRRNFRELDEVLEDLDIAELAGALFDLGVSSHQLEEPARGFSYRLAGPLDMRMGPDAGPTASTLVNEWPEGDLAGAIGRYGEERHAARIARAIVAARPIGDTLALAEIVAGAVPAAGRRSGHPARRTFQALRIAVNDELAALREGLEAALARLRPGGRCVVISYHSLEDRIVKERFSQGGRGCICPPELPVCGCGARPDLRLLHRSALRPAPEEVAGNPRARSARLRA
ncbi:MAG: 16S rRNA (cytosine(1402)-N(4))-methyltransferase RsmH, partial [Acidimicrobiia bacterium]